MEQKTSSRYDKEKKVASDKRYCQKNRDAISARKRVYYEKNRDRFKKRFKEYNTIHATEIKQQKWNARVSDPQLSWAKKTINTHIRKGHVVVFSVDELVKIVPVCCSICDRILVWNHKGVPQGTSPSLDRINNEKILTLQNIQIVCLRCNATKQNRTQSEFEEYCCMVADKVRSTVRP